MLGTAWLALARYAGRWYEIARLPNSFQKNRAGQTTADYGLLPDRQIRVVNSCVRPDVTRLLRSPGAAGAPAREMVRQ